MCHLSTHVSLSLLLPSTPLLFAARASLLTSPAYTFLSLHRRATPNLPVQGPSNPATTKISDLPAEIMRMIREELVAAVAQEMEQAWEAEFRHAHVEGGHEDVPFPIGWEANAAAGGRKGSSRPVANSQVPDVGSQKGEVRTAQGERWWNRCLWCETMRTNALWDLDGTGADHVGKGRGLLSDLKTYLASRGLALASNRPLDYLSPPSSSEPVLVISFPAATFSTALSSPPHTPSKSSAPYSKADILTFAPRPDIDLSDCSADKDEGPVGFVVDCEPATAANLEEGLEVKARCILARMVRELGLEGEELAKRGPRWVRVVEVDCECV